MSTLESRIIDLALAIGADIKSLNIAISNVQNTGDVNIDGGAAFTVFQANADPVIDGGNAASVFAPNTGVDPNFVSDFEGALV